LTVEHTDILALIGELMKFPHPQICRHAVACDLLSLLESKGWTCPVELAKAVVEADDETALRIIEHESQTAS
jgi:hypothetical protein